LAFLPACSSLQVEIPDIQPGITLPASGDGYQIGTVSHKEIRTPKAQWDEKRKRGITLFADDWAKLKETILKNCLANECVQSVGALDNLFIAIDSALKQLPTP
jgi:hypothetical protein